MFQTKVVEKIRTHILCSVTFFFRKSCLYEIMWKKYSRIGQATNDNMVHRLWMLDTQGCNHTLRICGTYCFSTATLVARKRVDITSHVPWLFWYFVAQQPSWFLASVEFAISQSVRHTTLNRTLPGKRLASRRDLYLTTHNTHKRQ